MKLAFAAGLVLSLSALAAVAQNTARQPGPSIIFSTIAPRAPGQLPAHTMTMNAVAFPSGCPVSLHAGHLADGSMVRTDGAHPRGLGQWLSLSLTSPDQKQIANATLTVWGMTPKSRLSLASGSGAADAEQTFHVPFTQGQKSAVARLWVPGMSAVQRIDVQSVEYSDGSMWRVASNANCQVSPDPFMLVTSR